MNNLKALLRVQLLMTWRGFRYNMGGGRSKWGLLLLPLLLLAFGPLIGAMFLLYTGLYMAGTTLGQGQVALVFALTGGQLACLMFGVFYVISVFYFGRDLKLLLPLPLRPGEIVLSKFIGILAGEYLTMAPVVLPALVVYGIFAKVSWTYIPFALIIYLLLPVLPLVIASLFSLVLMRVTNLKANRDVWRVVGGLVGVGMALLFQTVGRYQGGRTASSQAMLAFLQSKQSLVDSISRWFPTSIWATNALREGAPALGAGSFLLFAGVAVAALVLLTYVSEKLFFGGLVGGEETRASGRVLSRAELARETGQTRTPLWALLQREIRLLNRTPSFLMAAVLPVVMMPVVMALPLLQQKNELAKLLAKAEGVANSPLVPLIAIGALLFMNSVSNLPATAISREGRHFWISRSLPVPPRLQVQAKALHSLMFVTLNLVVVLAGLAFLHLLTVKTALWVVLGGLVASVATAYAGLVVDLLRPNLKWTDPQQAMKGNLNVLLGMVSILLLGGIFALASILLLMFAKPLVLPGVVVLFAAEAVGLSRFAEALADRRYLEYED
ncbi:MAG TPA: hypothetical protein VGK74_07155 [Symbiobacteriaceae bacterium]|jgi:ABC-2 type transport system permease protein